jgi:hypothetical protein
MNVKNVMTSYTQFTKWTSIKCAMLAIAEYLIQQTNKHKEKYNDNNQTIHTIN